jgi:hypothetical protein
MLQGLYEDQKVIADLWTRVAAADRSSRIAAANLRALDLLYDAGEAEPSAERVRRVEWALLNHSSDEAALDGALRPGPPPLMPWEVARDDPDTIGAVDGDTVRFLSGKTPGG